MKALILLLPAAAAGAYFSGSLEGQPALSEDARRAACAQLEEQFLTEGVVSHRLGSDRDPGQAAQMVQRSWAMDGEMRRYDCAQFDEEKRARNRAERDKRRERKELRRDYREKGWTPPAEPRD